MRTPEIAGKCTGACFGFNRFHRDFFVRNKNTFGRWYRKSNCKAVFITGTPPYTGKAFIQPVFAELYSWSDFVLTGKNVKLA